MTDIMISFIFNVLLGVIMFFLKKNNDDVKDEIVRLRNDVDKIKDSTVKKEDFREFKDQLWTRLDRLETDFKQQLTEFKR